MMPTSLTVTVGLVALLGAGSARADCFDEAARYQKVNPLILRAIAWQESHNSPTAVRRNANGSTDYGVMQINSVHLPVLAQYGISRGTLMEPCKNVYIAAWHLRQMMNKYGNTWAAIGAYHSETPALRDEYASQIVAILRQWDLMPPVGNRERASVPHRRASMVAQREHLAPLRRRETSNGNLIHVALHAREWPARAAPAQAMHH